MIKLTFNVSNSSAEQWYIARCPFFFDLLSNPYSSVL